MGIPLRLIDHQFRPTINSINNSSSNEANGKKIENLIMTQENPLHVRSHNLGFVSTTMSIAGDLRHPVDRAKELVVSINGDKNKPDIIFFQETFHEDATQVLCEGIKNEYPYIIHSVAPSFTGFNSGALIASKYPLKEIKFQTLAHMLGPEKASPRGIIKAQINSPNGPLILYGIHTQALIGEERAQSRLKQLKDVKQLMEDDLIKTPNAMQVLMGDFNTSRLTAWGEDNKTGQGKHLKGQAEEKVMDALNTYFDDPFIKDHDELTGSRKEGSKPLFLDSDNERMGVNLDEPSGSWFHGPFADPGLILSKKMKNDRLDNGRGAPEKAKGINVVKPTWGTPEWYEKQTANTARFDYILLPKNDTKLEAVVEIRRPYVPKGTQSSSSDHLPVDAKVWRK
jgi:endonuclease/exonuclease/phosphatase family metal-dependent hydrolase